MKPIAKPRSFQAKLFLDSFESEDAFTLFLINVFSDNSGAVFSDGRLITITTHALRMARTYGRPRRAATKRKAMRTFDSDTARSHRSRPPRPRTRARSLAKRRCRSLPPKTPHRPSQ